MMNLRLWLNAFIPDSVPGYTQAIVSGMHAGKTAIPLPGVARLVPTNLVKSRNAGYLTDQRGFDASPGASSRMQSLAMIGLHSQPISFHYHHRSSGTTEVDIESGDQLGFAVADMSKCWFRGPKPKAARITSASSYRTFPLGLTTTVAYPAATSYSKYVLEVKGAASDPLVSMAADIDYEGKFEIVVLSLNPTRVIVEFEGLVDEFPAFECYAELNGITKAIFQSAPPKGNTVSDLLGSANRPIGGTVRFP